MNNKEKIEILKNDVDKLLKEYSKKNDELRKLLEEEARKNDKNKIGKYFKFEDGCDISYFHPLKIEDNYFSGIFFNIIFYNDDDKNDYSVNFQNYNPMYSLDLERDYKEITRKEFTNKVREIKNNIDKFFIEK